LLTIFIECVFFSAVWLSIEGIPVNEDENGTSNSSSAGPEHPQNGHLSPALVQYFSCTTEALLGDDEDLVEVSDKTGPFNYLLKKS